MLVSRRCICPWGLDCQSSLPRARHQLPESSRHSFVFEVHGDAVLGEAPQLLDGTVVEFQRPFAGEKGDGLIAAVQALGPGTA